MSMREIQTTASVVQQGIEEVGLKSKFIASYRKFLKSRQLLVLFLPGLIFIYYFVMPLCMVFNSF